MKSTMFKTQILFVSIFFVVLISVFSTSLFSNDVSNNLLVQLDSSNVLSSKSFNNSNSTIRNDDKDVSRSPMNSRAVMNDESTIPKTNDLPNTEQHTFLEEQRLYVNKEQITTLVEELLEKEEINSFQYNYTSPQNLFSDINKSGIIKLAKYCEYSNFYKSNICTSFSIMKYSNNYYIFEKLVSNASNYSVEEQGIKR